MTRRFLSCTTIFLVTACWSTNALAQEKSPALVGALSRIGSGMPSAGLKFMSNEPDTRQIDVWTFRPLSLNSCTIQIQWTIDTTASPGELSRYILNLTYTIPLAKLDVQKIRVLHESGGAMGLTSSRDWEKGYFSVNLPTIGQQKTIDSVAFGQHKRVKNSQPIEGKVNSVHIDFKYKEPAENLATAFVQASRLCSAARIVAPKAP